MSLDKYGADECIGATRSSPNGPDQLTIGPATWPLQGRMHKHTPALQVAVVPITLLAATLELPMAVLRLVVERTEAPVAIANTAGAIITMQGHRCCCC